MEVVKTIWRAHLNNIQLFALLGGERCHVAVFGQLLFGVVQHGRRAADEGGSAGLLTEGVAVAGRVHNHGLSAGVDLSLHHGDLKNVGHCGLVARVA